MMKSELHADRLLVAIKTRISTGVNRKIRYAAATNRSGA